MVGASRIEYAGIYIKVVASNLNQTPGASITITRKLGTINSVQQQQISTWQIEQGLEAAEFFLINAVLIAGKPRFFHFGVTGGAGPDTTTQVVLSNVPASYSASARFFQPGDAVIDKFLALLH